MNYRVTAEQLGMTQPAVTQHIHYLENMYQCKLFVYDGKKLQKTKAARLLENQARSACYNEERLKKKLMAEPTKSIRIGATKTIGEFVIVEKVKHFLENSNVSLTVSVDNTTSLLRRLEQNSLDFAIVEGFFDKTRYGYMLYEKAPFVGICSKEHTFANREIELSDTFSEPLIVREPGSGTRAILDQLLLECNFSIHSFERQICISDFPLIKELVADNLGISFAYEVIAKKDPRLATFTIKNQPILREFNYVYLKDTNASEYIELFQGNQEAL